ncbi:MAG: response regulator receiver [Firmicutes bacterium]|nr:response regulator receiver [Bacillota bacterium]
MYKILVVDDEPAIRDLVEMLLVREGYVVSTAADGHQALALVDSFKPDLIILDIMLPDMNGHEVCRMVAERYHTPVIMLTAKNDVVDKVLGLEFGADDYITKPFDGRELLVRVKVLLRRLGRLTTVNQAISYLDLEINLDNKTVFKNHKNIVLTPKEFQILEIMAKNPQRVYSRDELLERIWGYDYLGDSRAVDIQIARLRKKLEDNGDHSRYIQTVHGFGYRFGGN